jgi:hypothetical protein
MAAQPVEPPDLSGYQLERDEDGDLVLRARRWNGEVAGEPAPKRSSGAVALVDGRPARAAGDTEGGRP